MSNAEFGPGSPGARIYRNMAWTSGNGRAMLRMQEDGGFVLYRDGKPVWQGEGAQPYGQYAVIQPDGNLVVYAEGDKPVWASNTNGKNGAVLVVQDDCNVCLYHQGTVIWATKTTG
ncbi:hypothetical protein [Streptomyces sp. NPDC055189]